MMHDKAWRVFRAASAFFLAACAGGDTPGTDADLREEIAERYANGAVASSGGSGGRSGDGGDGGSAQAAAGRNAGGSGGSGAGGSSDECDGFTVLSQNCSGSICHGDGSQYSDFAASEAAALAYVDESGEALCASEGPLIDPSNPAASIIIQKVTATTPPCGERMPITGTLSQQDISCLQDWIGSL